MIISTLKSFARMPLRIVRGLRRLYDDHRMRNVQRDFDYLMSRMRKLQEKDVDPQIMGRLTKAAQRLGNADAAAELLLLTIKADPLAADAYNDLGLLLEARGELYAASCCYVDALYARPAFPEAEFNLVCIRQRLFGGNL